MSKIFDTINGNIMAAMKEKNSEKANAYKNLKTSISEASKNKKSENDPLGKKDIKAINDAISQVNKAKTELENKVEREVHAEEAMQQHVSVFLE